jgi:hypothetical protein
MSLIFSQGNVSVRGLRYAQPIRENFPLTGKFGGSGFAWYAFKAPEVENNFVYDKSVDVWALGVILCKQTIDCA